jgi:hypothetical protein
MRAWSEMSAYQQTVLSQSVCIIAARYEDYLVNDPRIVDSSKRGEVTKINHVLLGNHE